MVTEIINLIVNFTLFIVSLFLIVVLGGLGIIYSILKYIFTLNINKSLNHFSKLFLSIAHSIDQTGNVMCSNLFNDLLLDNKKQYIKFGNADETISSVLGKNKKQGSLNALGGVLVNMLNFLDKNHVEKASEHPSNN